MTKLIKSVILIIASLFMQRSRINRDDWQNDRFCRIEYFIKASLSKASAGFNKISNLVKGEILMIIPIYAKVSYNYCFLIGE
ncbi:hypothetical protein SPBRAN_124 [uncultured Candidatus Thioglobus sp.]|nr:hypothetical protein SPBRAN_124 [uncultured Candidatus Thioglobus sp.]